MYVVLYDFRQNTPKVSYVSALDVWMCTCIIFVFFALLEYVVILWSVQQSLHLTNNARIVLSKLPAILNKALMPYVQRNMAEMAAQSCLGH